MINDKKNELPAHLNSEPELDAYFKNQKDILSLDQNDFIWIDHYIMLMNFEKEHGHSRVPLKYVASEFPLGSWAQVQRTKYRRKEILPYRRELLNMRTGWSWVIGSPNKEFGECIKIIENFITKNKHCNMPYRYCEDGFAIGQWVRSCRKKFQHGKLNEHQIARLEGIPGWKWTVLKKEETERAWDEWYRDLKSFESHHGHACVPYLYKINNWNLGAWVAFQRRAFKNKSLSPEREKKLNALQGWEKSNRERRWVIMFRLLLKYREIQGHYSVPVKYVQDGFALGKWVQRQRIRYWKNRLDPGRKIKLNELNGWKWRV